MSKLDELRESIDRLDEQIAPLLARRMALCREIGDYKRERGFPVTDVRRENELIERVSAAGDAECGEGAATGSIYRAIFACSRGIQSFGNNETKNVMKKRKSLPSLTKQDSQSFTGKEDVDGHRPSYSPIGFLGISEPEDGSARQQRFNRVIDITRELLSTPPYPGDPLPVGERVRSFAQGDEYCLTQLILSAHSATHIDAPLHFIDGGADIASISPERFVGMCIVTCIDGAIGAREIDLLPCGCERLLIKGTGVVTEEAAHAMLRHGITLVGVESQSVGDADAPAAVHRILLGAGVVLLEGLDLDGVLPGEYVLLAQPLKIAGCEGAPCRALLAENM